MKGLAYLLLGYTAYTAYVTASRMRQWEQAIPLAFEAQRDDLQRVVDGLPRALGRIMRVSAARGAFTS